MLCDVLDDYCNASFFVLFDSILLFIRYGVHSNVTVFFAGGQKKVTSLSVCCHQEPVDDGARIDDVVPANAIHGNALGVRTSNFPESAAGTQWLRHCRGIRVLLRPQVCSTANHR